MSKKQTEAQILIRRMEEDPCGGDERVIAELKRLDSVNNELLEVLKEMYDAGKTGRFYEDHDDAVERLIRARRAIKRAKG